MFTRESGSANHHRSSDRRPFATAACGVPAALAVGLLLWVDPFGDVLAELGHIDPLWVIAAAALEFASCVSYVMVFRRLFEPVPGRSAGKLASIGLGAGAVLPGGNVAGVALSCLLLHRDGVPTRRLVVRSSALLLLINGVGVAATGVAGALLLSGAATGPHDLLRAGLPVLVSGATAGVVLAIRVAVRRWSGRGPAWTVALADAVDEAGRSLRQPDWRLLGGAGYSLFDMAALWAACAATGHAPSFAALIVAYNIGYLASILPIPAGIGVLDGGLAAALIVYGASPSAALAAVLVYHALALWIPALCGVSASIQLRRERRPFTAPPAQLRQLQSTLSKKVSMSTPITHLTAQEHVIDLVNEARDHELRREARRNRHHSGVRRLALIVPAGSHFRLAPIRALPAGYER